MFRQPFVWRLYFLFYPFSGFFSQGYSADYGGLEEVDLYTDVGTSREVKHEEDDYTTYTHNAAKKEPSNEGSNIKHEENPWDGNSKSLFITPFCFVLFCCFSATYF